MIITYALARSVIVLGRLIRSHIPAIVLNALINVLSELLIVRRLEYLKYKEMNYGFIFEIDRLKHLQRVS